MSDNRPSWIFDSEDEAIDKYGFDNENISSEKAMATRKLDDYYTAYLFDWDGFEFYAVIVCYDVFEEGYEITEEHAGPFASIEDFMKADVIQTLF